jgi:acyl-CoA reductase-like NAD-dependent aldehyde dehydrogenase
VTTRKTNETLIQSQLIIDGEWRPALAGRTYEVKNPANPDELVGEAARAGKEDVELAVNAAAQAFPAWSALSFQERA